MFWWQTCQSELWVAGEWKRSRWRQLYLIENSSLNCFLKSSSQFTVLGSLWLWEISWMNELTFNFVPTFGEISGTSIHSSVLIYTQAAIVFVSHHIITNWSEIGYILLQPGVFLGALKQRAYTWDSNLVATATQTDSFYSYSYFTADVQYKAVLV